MICERLGIRSKPKRLRWSIAGVNPHIAEYSLELEDAA
jgi:hypothetical protein